MSLLATESAIDTDILERIRDAALKTAKAQAVYLFGSRARGDHREDSDYDVLVVTWETDRADAIRRAICDAAREFGAEADVKVVDPPTFLWRSRFANTVERAASREGVVLYMTEREDELREAANEWFQRANRDLRSAELLAQDNDLENACYHAQQSVEKCLKGYLTYRDAHVGRTHSMKALLEPCVQVDATFAQWRDPLKPFDRYAVEVLYPGGYEPSLEDAREAVEIARELRDFVLNRVQR